ncbi:MAG: hypothetical protein NXI32_17860 [bacterium]|nr:hypothetical protein [bacterium]
MPKRPTAEGDDGWERASLALLVLSSPITSRVFEIDCDGGHVNEDNEGEQIANLSGVPAVIRDSEHEFEFDHGSTLWISVEQGNVAQLDVAEILVRTNGKVSNMPTGSLEIGPPSSGTADASIAYPLREDGRFSGKPISLY